MYVCFVRLSGSVAIVCVSVRLLLLLQRPFSSGSMASRLLLPRDLQSAPHHSSLFNCCSHVPFCFYIAPVCFSAKFIGFVIS
uniref:Uncharacterized protein n=1 Tax=Physcomitrium patens TaxID=3218 RepID=A0A2K1K5Q7_PHYPA|nr:hypothetical protein PHYPA_011009 [Physcomitrium patens]